MDEKKDDKEKVEDLLEVLLQRHFAGSIPYREKKNFCKDVEAVYDESFTSLEKEVKDALKSNEELIAKVSELNEKVKNVINIEEKEDE